MTSLESSNLSATLEERLETPALLISLGRLKKNIERFAASAENRGVSLRPHVKTHRSPEIMNLQRKAGAIGFTAATLAEAEQCLESGFGNITYAVPIEPNKLDRAAELIRRGATLNLLVDSAEMAAILDRFCVKENIRPGLFLKIDCGNHRVGINPRDDEAVEIAKAIAEKKGYVFRGILAHAGHAYSARNRDELQRIAEEERDISLRFAEKLRLSSIPVEVVSIGSTPTFSTGIQLDGIDEVRPGNYVFFDYTQIKLGVCSPDEIALFVVASVVSIAGGRVVVDAGATALSKDPGPIHIEPDCGFGQVFSRDMTPLGKVEAITQEHGVLALDGLKKPKIGERLLIMPNHSCLVAGMFEMYYICE